MSGPWVQTVSGRKWNLLNPTPDAVDWNDITHALSRIYRFNGHTLPATPVTVAAHSLNVSLYLRRVFKADVHLALHGLLHDAHEAFIGDQTTPVSRALDLLHPGYRDALEDLKRAQDRAIFTAAGLNFDRTQVDAGLVKEADLAVLHAERAYAMAEASEPWGMGDPPDLRASIHHTTHGHNRMLAQIRRLRAELARERAET